MAHFRRERNLNPVLIIGCGDIGRRVAALCLAQDATVHALTRNPATADRLAAQGVITYLGDLDGPAPLVALPTNAATVFYFAPPPAQGGGEPRLRAFLQQCAQALPAQVIYISTSGVYGDCKGGWVTEDTAPKPGTDRARRRLAAEGVLRDWQQRHHVPVIVLRVGGIYGPGRLPLERIKQGQPVLREQDGGPTNRIHADDLAAVCMAAARHGGAGLYNVSDGHPSTMTDYFNQIADLYGFPRPPQVGLEEAQGRMSAEMMSYLKESRRMDNQKMLRELGVRLRYPTLRDGLAAMAANGQS